MAPRSRRPSKASVKAEEARRLLEYDPVSGALTWRHLSRHEYGSEMAWRAQCRQFGKAAGSILLNGYRSVAIGGKRYYAHRLAWLVMTGEWPTADIDHVNGCRDDNRWSNLREATRSQNHQNRVGHEFTGTSLNKRTGRWRATIVVGGVQKEIGQFATREAAAAAYRGAKAGTHKFQPVVRGATHGSS